MSKSASLRRIQADVRELLLDPSDRYHAAPLENDMFEWHFTIRGADGTDFEGGIYHGRILLPPEYPFKPPHIIFLTPSGRFDINTKICLSFSAYHPELWQPAWGIRLILEALIAFLPSPADGAIGALDWTSEERKRLAQKSVHHVCPRCGKVADLLPQVDPEQTEKGILKEKKKFRFEKEIEALKLAQIANESKNAEVKAKSSNKSDELLKLEEEKDKIANNDVEETLDPMVEIDNSIQDDSPGHVVDNHVGAIPEIPINENANDNDVRQHTLEIDISWLVDPLLNISMVFLAVICILLTRKAGDLLTELHIVNRSLSAFKI